MRKLMSLGAIVAIALMVASCTTTKALYSWYDYEDVVYEYNKTPTEQRQVRVLELYKKLSEHQTGARGVVPPGMYAEYGYLLCKTGKREEGLAFLKKEIALYPESERYISRIIKRLEE